MTTALRVLDDGAWISVGDERRVSVSELWQPTTGFCDCEPPDLLVGGFVAVGVDGRTIEARVYGDCIRCGRQGTTEWLPVGRLVDGSFHHVDRESVLRPAGAPVATPAVAGTPAGTAIRGGARDDRPTTPDGESDEPTDGGAADAD